jgi:hypothetical protein
MHRIPPRLRTLAVFALAWVAGCGGSSDPATPTAAATPTPTPVPMSPAVSPSGLALLFHMDEAAWDGTPSQVRDSSGAGRNGTAVAGATTVAGGRFGRAGSFPGGAGCIAIPESPGLRPTSLLTVSAWLMSTGIGRGNAQGIAAKRVNFQQSSAYAFFVGTSDRLTVDVDTEDDRFEAGAPLASGRWYHVAFVYRGNEQTVTVYLNGAPVGAHSERASSITPFTSPLWVGCLPEGTPSQGFVGLLDEVAVWHEALSAAEIGALASATGPIADP